MKEQETTAEKLKVRPLRIGIIGAMSSGKTTLAGLVGEKWGIKPIEERFRENPYLPDFYANPRENNISFKCQVHFLGLKAEDMAVSTLELEEYQIISSTAELVEVFVPSDEMDALYAKVQHDMKMMDDLEWDLYKKAHTALKRCAIIDTDLDLVLSAPPDVLYTRIIDVRGRDFEQREFFENNPDYLSRLDTAVSAWGLMKKKAGEKPVVLIDSASNNFVSNAGDKEGVLEQIENEIVDFLSKNPRGKDGTQFITPDFLKVK